MVAICFKLASAGRHQGVVEAQSYIHPFGRDETQVIDFVPKLRWQFQEWKLELVSVVECDGVENHLPVWFLGWSSFSSSSLRLCWLGPSLSSYRLSIELEFDVL